MQYECRCSSSQCDLIADRGGNVGDPIGRCPFVYSHLDHSYDNGKWELFHRQATSPAVLAVDVTIDDDGTKSRQAKKSFDDDTNHRHQ
jgi:hypothetical protein